MDNIIVFQQWHEAISSKISTLTEDDIIDNLTET